MILITNLSRNMAQRSNLDILKSDFNWANVSTNKVGFNTAIISKTLTHCLPDLGNLFCGNILVIESSCVVQVLTVAPLSFRLIQISSWNAVKT